MPSGGHGKNAKSCRLAGIDFRTITEAAKYFNVQRRKIIRCLKEGVDHPNDLKRKITPAKNSKTCKIGDKEFPSRRAAARHFGIGRATLDKWIERGVTNHEEWKAAKIQPRGSSKPCTFSDRNFKSLKEAKDVFGVSYNTIYNWIERGVIDPLGDMKATLPDLRPLRIYGWKYKPNGKIRYIGKTARLLRERKNDYKKSCADTLVVITIQDHFDDWEMVPVAKYPDITPSLPNYTDLVKEKENYWIDHYKTRKEQGGLNSIAGGGGGGWGPLMPDIILPEVLEEAISLYETGQCNYAMLAEKFNVNRATLIRKMKARGVKTMTPHEVIKKFGFNSWAGRSRFNPDEDRLRKEARKMRRKGMTLKVIGEALNVPPNFVAACCRDLPAAPQPGRCPPKAIVKMRRLAEQGKSTAEIVAETGYSRPTVIRHVRDIFEKNPGKHKCLNRKIGGLDKATSKRIRKLRAEGHSYQRISEIVGVNERTARRHSKGVKPPPITPGISTPPLPRRSSR